MVLLAELHDFRRFPDPRALMAYLGLVPSEHSSGDRQHRGRITKTGNTLVRRVLIEASWHYQHRAGRGASAGRAAEGPTGARDCDRRHRPTTIVSAIPSPHGQGQTGRQSRRRGRT